MPFTESCFLSFFKKILIRTIYTFKDLCNDLQTNLYNFANTGGHLNSENVETLDFVFLSNGKMSFWKQKNHKFWHSTGFIELTGWPTADSSPESFALNIWAFIHPWLRSIQMLILLFDFSELNQGTGSLKSYTSSLQ